MTTFLLLILVVLVATLVFGPVVLLVVGYPLS